MPSRGRDKARGDLMTKTRTVQTNMKRKKGVILIYIAAALLFISFGVASMLTVLNTRIRQYIKSIDRSAAYYLCETGLSFALLDINMNRVGPGNTGGADCNMVPGQPCRRTYNFAWGGGTIEIHYQVAKTLIPTNDYEVTAYVASPFGLGGGYTLEMRAIRGFPWFMRGKAH